VSAIGKGRARLAALQTPDEAATLADEIRLDSVRRNLLPWVVMHDRDRLSTFLSPFELLWLGGQRPAGSNLDAWGASAYPRSGCLCLKLFDGQWETLIGRWGSGMLASSLPDLNLRLAELLNEMRMPAALLGSVLSAAALDFVTNAPCRDQDDRRGLVDFVHGLRQDRMEQYLGLLTTNGPLVPLGPSSSEGTPPTARTGEPQ
jgi:hypothetical protein